MFLKYPKLRGTRNYGRPKAIASLILKYFTTTNLNWAGGVTVDLVSDSCFALFGFTGVAGASDPLIN